MIYPRRTVAEDVHLEGLGLHSGEPVKVSLHPGSGGIWFRMGAGRWQATPANVTDTTRSTRLGEVGTVEHLMSALCGLGITDLEVEVTAGEMPALDGSSIEYVQAIQGSGVTELGESRITEPYARVFLQHLPVKIAIGKGEGRWRYELDFDQRWPGRQSFESANVIADYSSQIAPARTFATEEEVPHLLASGLAKGLGIEQALILGKENYVNEARFPEEPARHKLLDLMGDLYLAGVPASLLNVTAERSGHRTNVEAAAMLWSATHGASHEKQT